MVQNISFHICLYFAALNTTTLLTLDHRTIACSVLHNHNNHDSFIEIAAVSLLNGGVRLVYNDDCRNVIMLVKHSGQILQRGGQPNL